MLVGTYPQIKNDLAGDQSLIKMSSVLNLYNCSRKPEEFSLKNIEVLVDSKEQNWFKKAHMGKFLGLSQTEKSLVGLDKCEIRARNEFESTHTTTTGWSGPKDHQNKTDKFLSVFGVMYVIIKSQKDKGKALKKHILKDIVPRGFDARIEEIQGKHQQAITDRDNQIQALEFTNEKHQQKILRLNKEIVDLVTGT